MGHQMGPDALSEEAGQGVERRNLAQPGCPVAQQCPDARQVTALHEGAEAIGENPLDLLR